MITDKKDGVQWVNGSPYARWRAGKERHSVALGALGRDPAVLAERRDLMVVQARRLVEAGRRDQVIKLCTMLAEATTAKALRVAMLAVDTICEEARELRSEASVKDIGDRWVSGELARRYPDHIKVKKSAKRDKELLTIYVYPVIGDMPIQLVQLADGERVMRRIPALNPRRTKTPKALSVATRRHVAQAMHRLLEMACYPMRLIASNPLPHGFLPKLGPGKAKQYLYPDEDAKLLACESVPIAFRLLYGVIAREGLRFGEALALTWADLDLERGAVRLDENKTDEPRAWALDPAVAATLRRWKKLHTGKDDKITTAGPFVGMPDDEQQASRFRSHLKIAAVDRAELHKESENRGRIRVHDLRATFVTVSLANGKTESWVADRTGHKSSTMIARYQRAARTLAELGMGPLRPLLETIAWPPEHPGKTTGKSGQVAAAKNTRTEGGTRTLTPFRMADFESDVIAPVGTPGASDAPDPCSRRPPRSTLYPSLDPGERSVDASETLAQCADGLVALGETWSGLDRFQAAVEAEEPALVSLSAKRPS